MTPSGVTGLQTSVPVRLAGMTGQAVTDRSARKPGAERALPGVIVGGLLGWAHTIRLSGGRRGWRWLGAAPAVFAIAPMLLPGGILAFVTQGLGGGAVAIALLAIGGGFAISGRGRLWARIVCGVISALLIVGVTITTFNIAGPRLAVTEPRGVWVALLALSLLTLLAIAASIPFRPVIEAHPAGAVRVAASERRDGAR